MRFIVVGTSGSGKSTFAQQLASARGVPYIEMDELFWLPDWTQRQPDDFRDRVAAAASGPEWVIDGNYSVARDVLWPCATDIIWLNFDRMTVFSRITKRTFQRALHRQVLWAGNRESFRKAFLSRDSILLWSLTTFDKNRQRYSALRASKAFPRLAWHEFRTPRQAQAFLQSQSAA